jgi:hypothetical protein
MANNPFRDNDPGDVEFFEGVRKQQEEPMLWWRAADSYNLDANQMRALGRVVVGAMTEHGTGQTSGEGGDAPIQYLDDATLAVITGEISAKMSAILRKTIITYSSHYSTMSEKTSLGRDNVAFVFCPTLVYNGTQVNFVFDRLNDEDAAMGV